MPAMKQGPCYNCGEDHWIKDCPYVRKDAPQPPETSRRPTTTLPQLSRFGIDCGIKHLVQDCPSNPEAKGKATLNYVEVMPSTSAPSSSESEKVVPLKVVTRAQAKAKAPEENDEKSDAPSKSSKRTTRSWKARRARRAASKKKQQEKEQAAQEKQKEPQPKEKLKAKPAQEEPNQKKPLVEEKEKSLGGSVLGS